MSLERTKPIDDLSEECADHGLVIVPDAPLARALNRRIDRPRVGPLAVTPQRLVETRRRSDDRRTAFLAVIEHTDLSWKRAATVVDDVLGCWRHTGSLEGIREYDRFDTPAVRAVIDCLERTQTTARALEAAAVDPTARGDVAVLQEERLLPIERSVVPADATPLEPFLEVPFDPPPVHRFDTPAGLVDALIDVIDPDRADDVAVVLESGSEYSALLKSALETAGVPYHGGPGFTDDQDHRAALSFLRLLFAGEDVRVGAVRPLVTHLGGGIDRRDDERRLADVDAPVARRLVEYRDRRGDWTVDEALAAFERELGRTLDAFRLELTELGIANIPLAESIVDRLAFYLETVEVPVEHDDDGVLLADPTSSAFVDRPVVFCLGLDDGWTHDLPDRPWVDRDAAVARNRAAFQLLIQSGVDRHYLVVDGAGGEAITPTRYLDDLYGEPVERFGDLEGVDHGGGVRATGSGFDREPLEASLEPVRTVSQSTLNTFVNCPREHLFSRLVEGPDTRYLLEGSLFHDFAEFYATHPDALDGLEEIVELFLDRTDGFYRDVDRPTRRTRYRAGLETIVRFLDDRGPSPTEGDTVLTSTSGVGENAIAEHFDRSIEGALTERRFEDEELGISGVIDLVAGPDHLVDYKSGSRRRSSTVTRRSAVDPPADTPDFQAVLYLTYLRSRRPDTRLSFTFVHFLESLDDIVRGEPAALEECTTTVTYRPVPYADFVASREAYEGLCEEAARACTETLSAADYGTYREVVESVAVPRTRSNDEMIDSAFCAELTDRLREVVGDTNRTETGCEQACRYLAGLRRESFFADDLDAFERFVEERLAELNAYRRGEERFPVAGPAGEPNYRRVDHRDLLLEGPAGTGGDR